VARASPARGSMKTSPFLARSFSACPKRTRSWKATQTDAPAKPSRPDGRRRRAPPLIRSSSISLLGDRRRASNLAYDTFGSKPNDLFQAARLPFGPGSPGAAVPAAHPSSCVEGFWSPALVRVCAEDLSLSGGASSSTYCLFTLSIILSYSSSETTKATRGVALDATAMRGVTSASTSQRGRVPTRSSAGHRRRTRACTEAA
jgi:hypothetical protein